jgi:hypothetical protein
MGMHLDRQVFDARLHDLLVATIVELDGVGVSACFENDVIFLGQSFVPAGRQTVEGQMAASLPSRSLETDSNSSSVSNEAGSPSIFSSF